MQLFSKTPSFNFMGPRRAIVAFSVTLTVVCLAAIIMRGLNYGLEFTGGVLLEVTFDGAVALEDVRATLEAEGYAQAQVQTFGTTSDVMIRLPPVEVADEADALGNEVLTLLREAHPSLELLRPPVFVGSQVGADIFEQAGLALLFASIMVFIYVMLRFRWKFAVGALASVVHDVIVTVGFFAIMGYTVDLSVLAAVLAVIGYSLNDTVVIYDRIRENFRLMRRGTTEQIVNASLNQTLARTLITGPTSLLVLFSLWWFAGETLFEFAIALIVGILIGTYSSMYVSGAAVIFLNVLPADMVPPKREELDDIP